MDFMKQRPHSQQLQHKLNRIQFTKQYVYNVMQKSHPYYPLIDTFAFERSPNKKYKNYYELTKQLIDFNSQLELYNNLQIQLKDILVNYNIYKNLSSRMKILDMYQNKQLLVKQLISLKNWYTQTKGNKFYKIYPISSQNKNSINSKQEFKNNYRTFNPEYDSPQVRLLQYKTKQLIVNFGFKNNLITQNNPSKTFFPSQSKEKQFHSAKTAIQQSNNKNSNLQYISNEKQQTPLQQLNQQTSLNQDPSTLQVKTMIANSPLKKPYTSDNINKIGYGRIRQIQSADKTIEPNFARRRFFEERNKILNKKIDQQAIRRIFTWSKAKSRRSSSVMANMERGRQKNGFKNLELKSNEKKVQIIGDRYNKFFPYKTTQKPFTKNSLFDNNIQSEKKKLNQSKNKKNIKNLPILKNNMDQKLQLEHKNEYKNPQKNTMTRSMTSLQLKQSYKSSLTSYKLKNPQENNQQKIVISNNPIDIGNKNEKLNFLQKAKQIQGQIQEFHIQKTLSTFSKYINHTPIVKNQDNQNTESSKNSKIKVLTAGFQKKRSILFNKLGQSFAQILFKHHAKNYNNELQKGIEGLKNVLSTKGLAINSNTIVNSFKIPTDWKFTYLDKMYKTGDHLISNPWFPKNLYLSNEKTKKNG